MENEQSIIIAINRFYEIISGKRREERNWTEMRDLFIESAVLTPYVFGDDTEVKVVSYNIEGYINRLKQSNAEHDIHEKGFNYKIDIYGNIANVYSEYSAEITKTNETYMKKGINLIQLLKSEKGWKIVSMLWENTRNAD